MSEHDCYNDRRERWNKTETENALKTEQQAKAGGDMSTPVPSESYDCGAHGSLNAGLELFHSWCLAGRA